MKKRLLVFLLLFVFGITTVKAANVAEVNGTGYDTIAKAVNAAPNNTQTTITLIADRTNEKITIGSNKDIVLDLNDHTLTMNNDSNLIAISNGGKLEIINGTLITTAKTKGMIDNNGGTLYITSGTYNANGERQVVYNNAGTVYIQGGELEGNAPARAAVHNLNNGKLYITGGTIVSNTLVANKVRSSMLPSYIYIDTRKELEDIINDDTTGRDNPKTKVSWIPFSDKRDIESVAHIA